MNRLVDYFIILGFDDQKQAGTLGSGKVLQRFPENDWPDVPLIDGLELFCQPLGWRLSSTQQEPSFFVSVMTYMDANKHYCAFLSFYEPISLNSIKQPDEEDSEIDVILDPNASGSINDCSSSNSSTMFAPKCIVLQSRHNFVEVFKNCLETIYTIHLECMDIPLEKLVGNLLCIEVPSPGSQLKFSIGANDKQLLTMPLSTTVPVTGTTVVQLFERLNVHNVISLFTAVMTDNKILFQSDSYSLLYESCHALTSLMYPFVYSHVYIPLLPSSLLEMLSSPTPFIMGVHSSLQDEVEDLLDVIVVDLDVGCISIPDCIHLPKLDGPAYNEMVYQLRSVITPQLMRKDVALRSSHLKSSPPHLLDKEIRAIFVRLFAQMLQGYRTCLQIVRINPKPFITFHKASFLGKRNLVENEFVVRLLESMFFNSFVQERGTPYRASDLFDELYATMHDTLKREMANPELVIKDIKELAHQLYLNEHPHPKDPNQIKIPLPTEGVFTRVHQPKFPTLKSEIIQEILDDDRIRREMLTVNKPKPKAESRIIAFGPAFCVPFNSDSALFTNSARRLEVMRNCINCIFEEKIQDARKSFPAVLRALKNKSERLALAKELAAHVTGNKCVLTHEQFDLIVRLMNCALQQDCDYLDGSASGLRLRGLGDVNGLAAAILPLSMKFCRRLGIGGNAGVLQFAYTCLQDHLIWENMGFWESTFYQNVEAEVTSLYGSTKDTHLTPLDIAAEQIRLKPKLSEQQIQQYASSEESTVYSQAVDYTHQIVSLKIPLDIGCHEKNTRSAKLNNSSVEGGHHSDTNSNFTGTGGGAGRESYRDDKDHEKEARDFDNESGFEEGSNGKGQAAVSEISVNVIKFLGRFIDKVCTDGGVTEDHIKSLHSMIPDIVAIHCNTLDAIYKESKNIPPVTKPKIITPSLLPGEDLVMKSLRAYLIPDGRDEVLGSAVSGSSVTQIPQPIGGPVLLPAEGAIFLTNYRVIFRGRPCDQYAAENVIVRSFPIATLVKEKKVNISSKYLIETIDQCIQEGLQLRSNIFELMKIAFDEEVSSEDIETLRKMINKARTPPNVFHMFAFTSQIAMSHQLSLLNLQKQKEKSTTFKGMAKKTLMRTAQMAGLKTKSRKSKYLLPASGIYGSKTLTPGYNRQSIMVDSVDDKSVSDDLSINSDSSHVHTTSTLPPLSSSSVVGSNVDVHLSPVNPKDSRTLKKLTELSYVKDYQRLGLGSVKDILSPNGVNNYIGVTSPTSSKSFKTSNLNNSTSSSNNCDGFRISSVNSSYMVAGSYPAFLAVPASVSDDSLQRLSRCYKFCRFPVIVWKHPTSKGLLLRASSFHGKGVIGILKGGHHGTATPVVSNSHNSSNISVPSSSTNYSETSSNIEQEKYFQALINLTPSYYDPENSQRIETDYSIPSLVLSGRHESIASSAITGGVVTGRSTPPPFTKDHKKTNVMASFSRAMNNIRASGGKQTFGTIGHSVGKQWSKLNSSSTKNYHESTNYTVEDVSSMTVTTGASSATSPTSPLHSSNTKTTTPSNGRKGGVTSSNTSGANGAGGPSDLSTSNSRKCIYIFGEKGLIKSARSDHLSNMIEFVPIEYHEVRQVKQSFKKLLKACCPSSCLTDPEQSFIRQVENSEWLNQLQTIMRISSAIIDLIDLQGSTVTLCLEDDLDLVPQIVSVAELCLDPYYRTFEGFRVLIEKEWLAFGHRFSHRSNHTAQTITSGFAPIFLQFLDIVHQIMRQFPLSFQFNEYYLRFIAYHYVSCRFRTFLLDSEAERAKYGWPLEDATRKYSDFADDGYEYDIDDDVLSGSTNGTLTSHTVNGLDIKSTSFWDYAERIWSKSPIFYNFYYIPTSYLCPESSLCVLRPYCSISNLKIWDYYLTEQLNHGPSYDFEVVQYEKQRREEIEATEQNKDKSKRTIINASYDCTTHFQANCFEEMLEKVKNMEMELGKSNGPQQKWHSIWDRMEIPVINSSNSNKMINSNELVNRQGSIKSQILGRYARTVHHKKNTIDLKKLFSKRLKQKSNHPKLNNDIYLQ